MRFRISYFPDTSPKELFPLFLSIPRFESIYSLNPLETLNYETHVMECNIQSSSSSSSDGRYTDRKINSR
ncbi:hypothetical protein R1flu_013200 [Riccia fluitans]|uniref:Uncharacterized protein n=1 Tax=Riccia fluitans TaxID=41844 RepID=A0ABD1YDN4_9MARC